MSYPFEFVLPNRAQIRESAPFSHLSAKTPSHSHPRHLRSVPHPRRHVHDQRAARQSLRITRTSRHIPLRVRVPFGVDGEDVARHRRHRRRRQVAGAGQAAKVELVLWQGRLLLLLMLLLLLAVLKKLIRIFRQNFHNKYVSPAAGPESSPRVAAAERGRLRCRP